MKNSIIIILALFSLTTISGFQCGKNDFSVSDTVKLNATISNTNEIINLGDTLKITFVLPSMLNTIDSYGNPNNVTITSLLEAWYSLKFYRIDTATNSSTIFRDNTPNYFATQGHTSGSSVYTTTTTPYVSVLNIVPPTKGVYYLEVPSQPSYIRANSGYKANLITNFAVADKHWVNFAVYFNGPNQPDFITSVTKKNADGYGFYCFRVN